MKNQKPLKATATKIAYQNPWVKLREDEIVRPDGRKGIYGYLDVKDSVLVVAVNDLGEVCLVESYRHPFQDWFWELPGGGGEGEAIFEASKRELEEENAITASDWQLLGESI